MWVVGAVPTAVGGGATDGPVDGTDAGDAALGDVDRAERRRREEMAGPLQSAPRIAAVARVRGDTGHRQRVQRLQHEGAQAADEHRRIGMDRADRCARREPSRPGRSEQTDVRRVTGDS